MSRPMKAKTIRKILNAVFNSWLKSIDEKETEFKQRIQEGTIITGGSIVSMLMGEQVNDFDLYFRSMELATKIAEYYVKKFKEQNLQEPASFCKQISDIRYSGRKIDEQTFAKLANEFETIISTKSI